MMTRRALTIAATLAIGGSALMAATTAAAEMMADAPHPAHIHEGLCPEPGGVVAPLADVAPAAGSAMGPATAVPVEISMTTVELALADILAAEHSINVHQSADALDVYIACGDIGGMEVSPTDLAIGLAEQNDSHHLGAAWLHDNGDGTTSVSVFLVGFDQMMDSEDDM
jgi:hypothetical protein